MKGLEFTDQWLLWVLVPIFILWIGLWVLGALLARVRRRGTAAVRFSSIGILETLRPARTVLYRRLVMGLRILTVALLIMAMA